MSNAVYHNAMENLRNRIDARFLNNFSLVKMGIKKLPVTKNI